MRLVWVVIPLVLFGFIGIQESFAESEWGYGESNIIVDELRKISTVLYG